MAQGCVVVFVSENGNETKILKRANSTNSAVISDNIKIVRPLHCYTGVFGYDIESDGTVGTLAVPGEQITAFSMVEFCMEHINNSQPPTSEYICLSNANSRIIILQIQCGQLGQS